MADTRDGRLVARYDDQDQDLDLDERRDVEDGVLGEEEEEEGEVDGEGDEGDDDDEGEEEGDEDEEEEEDDDDPSNDPPLPEWLAEDVRYWHRWYVAIVHKSANVAVRRPFRYTEGYAQPLTVDDPYFSPPFPSPSSSAPSFPPLSSPSSSASFDPTNNNNNPTNDNDDPTTTSSSAFSSLSPFSLLPSYYDTTGAPFPFNLEAHWYCGFVVAIVISLHVFYFYLLAIRQDTGSVTDLNIFDGLLFGVRSTQLYLHHHSILGRNISSSGGESGGITVLDFFAWSARIVGRSFLTLAISVGSTLVFEVGGEYTSRKVRGLAIGTREFVEDVLIVRVLGWGDVEDEEGNLGFGDGNGNDEEDGQEDEEEEGEGEDEREGERARREIVWLRDQHTALREFLREIICEAAVYAVDYIVVLAVATSGSLLSIFADAVLDQAGFLFLRDMLSLPTANARPTLTLTLPIPLPCLDQQQQQHLHLSANFTASISNASYATHNNLNNSCNPDKILRLQLQDLWLEYGTPILLQLFLIIFLWLTWLMFLAQAERWALYGWRVEDAKSALYAHLARATALHLIAYTAYQAVCLIDVSLSLNMFLNILPLNLTYYYPTHTHIINKSISSSSPFLTRLGLIPLSRNNNILASCFLLFFHWVIRFISISFIIKFAEPLFTPYLVWCTRFTREGARSMWPALTHPLRAEMDVLDPSRRVVSRVLMTLLFGLDSSWPAKAHLSNIVADD